MCLQCQNASRIGLVSCDQFGLVVSGTNSLLIASRTIPGEHVVQLSAVGRERVELPKGVPHQLLAVKNLVALVVEAVHGIQLGTSNSLYNAKTFPRRACTFLRSCDCSPVEDAQPQVSSSRWRPNGGP
jgi:hypothetical protein